MNRLHSLASTQRLWDTSTALLARSFPAPRDFVDEIKICFLRQAIEVERIPVPRNKAADSKPLYPRR